MSLSQVLRDKAKFVFEAIRDEFILLPGRDPDAPNFVQSINGSIWMCCTWVLICIGFYFYIDYLIQDIPNPRKVSWIQMWAMVLASAQIVAAILSYLVALRRRITMKMARRQLQFQIVDGNQRD